MIKRLLTLPEAVGLDLDDPKAAETAAEIIRRKRFLHELYVDWYQRLCVAAQGAPQGEHLEIGSGGGFLKSMRRQMIASELFPHKGIDLVCSAENLPFPDESLAVVYMTNVLHHIPRPRMFLCEIVRCLKPGGRLLMIEPYNTIWGRCVWKFLHHEPFDEEADWELKNGGPLTGANSAAPWIIFSRDRDVFEREYPSLRIHDLNTFMPLTYLLSGGVSMRTLVPESSFRLLRNIERLLGPAESRLGIFALIEVHRRHSEIRD